MRTLFLDVRGGVTTANLLAALLDLGVAPSPLLSAVADLRLPVELRLEPGRVTRVGVEGEALVRPGEMLADLAPLAADAVGRLVVDALRGEARAAAVDAGALALLHATALAVESLQPERVLVGEVRDASPDARAFLEALAPEGFGAAEPSWRGHAAWGAARDPPRVRVALGVSPP